MSSDTFILYLKYCVWVHYYFQKEQNSNYEKREQDMVGLCQ